MKYCLKCGNKLDPTDRFCNQCGFRIPVAKVAAPAASDEPVEEQAAAAQPAAEQTPLGYGGAQTESVSSPEPDVSLEDDPHSSSAQPPVRSIPQPIPGSVGPTPEQAASQAVPQPVSQPPVQPVPQAMPQSPAQPPVQAAPQAVPQPVTQQYVQAAPQANPNERVVPLIPIPGPAPTPGGAAPAPGTQPPTVSVNVNYPKPKKKRRILPVFLTILAILAAISVVYNIVRTRTRPHQPSSSSSSSSQSSPRNNSGFSSIRSPKNGSLSDLDWMDSGTYEVGADIEAGEYFLLADNGAGYFEVVKDESGSFDSIIANDNFATFAYISVQDGTFFEVSRARFIPVSDKEEQGVIPALFEDGMYKVGFDIPAGEYLIEEMESDSCYIEVDKDCLGTFDSIVANDIVSSRHYVTVSEGQYLDINRGRLIPISEASPAESKNGRFDEGMYKVGFDIQPGEYLIRNTGRSCFFEVCKDSLNVFDGVVANGFTDTRHYVTVSDGQYLKLQDGEMIPADMAEPYKPKDGVYDQGMYKVGFDIPAGSYTVTGNDSFCLVEVSSDSLNIFESIQNIESVELAESKTVTVADGQYLTVSGGTFVPA